MGIFGEIRIPTSTNTTDLTLIRDTNNYDIFLNYACAVHGITAFLIGLTLTPLILYYHSVQQRSLAVILFLCISSLDLARSIYSPIILVPKLLSRDLPHYLELDYKGWVGYVNNMFPLLMEIEFILLVALCTVRYVGVRYPQKSLRPISLITIATVVLRVLFFLAGAISKWVFRPLFKVRHSQLVFSMNEKYALRVTLVTLYVKYIMIGLVLIYGMVISVMTIRYLNILKKTTAASKIASTRNRKSINIIVIMNTFSGFVTLGITIHAVNLILNPVKRYSTADNFISYGVVHGLPLSQSIFNSVSFVCVSSSFRRFLLKLKRGSLSRTNLVSISGTVELSSRKQSLPTSRVEGNKRERSSGTKL
ncbi:uncharacterized protein LOC134818871 [Bolinopsis microptera]|uniref:uncharacterized protein LOC134818871 n=1 Tax=Bolinopsis microptera TaxID=2820187 RepID=UPI00307B01CC